MPPKVMDAFVTKEKGNCKWCGKKITMDNLYALELGNGKDGPLCEDCWFSYRKGKVKV